MGIRTMCNLRVPRKQRCTPLRMQKLILVRNQLTAIDWVILLLSAISWASLSINLLVSGEASAEVENTWGVKLPYSTFRTLSS